MADEKSFLTYNQQMRRLRDVKSIECEGSPHKQILVRAGYFNIINGYKTPFICDTDAKGNHVYLPNTSIEQLYVLKKFDDELRLFLLNYITQVEEEVRTLTGYKFDQCNLNGKIPWYDTSAYSPSSRLQDRMNAISSAYSELSASHQEYVKFYMENHTLIPTWIMIKVVNFSTFINVLQNSKTSVTHSICKLYGMLDKKRHPNVKLLIGSLHWLRTVRNSCAHNERIYCIHQSANPRRTNSGRIIEDCISRLPQSYSRDTDKRIFDLLIYFKYYLPNKEYQEMMSTLQSMLCQLQHAISQNAFEYVRGQMGIKNLAVLDTLKSLKKNPIEYNGFDKMQ